MKQRKPMSRGQGFKRAEFVRLPPSAPTRGRGGRISVVSAAATTICKTVAHRNPGLLAMARGQSCTLRIAGVCNGDRDTVVAAHSNLSIHGKAGARKADDQYHVHACSACHRWLDQGPADAVIKEMAFMRAHLWMVAIWRDITAGMQHATPKERAAAQWALDRLNASPVGLLESPL